MSCPGPSSEKPRCIFSVQRTISMKTIHCLSFGLKCRVLLFSITSCKWSLSVRLVEPRSPPRRAVAPREMRRSGRAYPVSSPAQKSSSSVCSVHCRKWGRHPSDIEVERMRRIISTSCKPRQPRSERSGTPACAEVGTNWVGLVQYYCTAIDLESIILADLSFDLSVN